MKCGPAIAFMIAALAAMPLAAKEKINPAVNADNKEAFATVSQWVRKQMDEGGRYGHVAATDRMKVDAKLTEMGTLFDQRGAVAQMTNAEKTQMFNDQEEVNAILAKRDSERLICKSDMPVGSHIPVTTCHTAREIEETQRTDADYLRRISTVPQPKSGH